MENVTSQVLKGAKLKTSKVLAVRNALQNFALLGLFRVQKIEDETYSFDDLCGDVYNPAANPEIPADELAKQKRAFRARVNRQGVYGFVFQVRGMPSNEWETVESTWGFVGNDCIGSGYDIDMMHAAYDWLTAPGRLDDMATALDDLRQPVTQPKIKTLAELEAENPEGFRNPE